MEDIRHHDREERKKAIFNSMSARRRNLIEKKGYEKWDPFEEPKDPIDIRRDATKRTTQQLVRAFLQNCGHDRYSNAYGRGVLEMALGIINADDRFLGMFEFAKWYQEQLNAKDATADE
jgi:hypothetical protein